MKKYIAIKPVMRNRKLHFLGFLLIALGLTACKKETALPGDQADIALNFYAASDVMATAYTPTQSTVAVYVDNYQQQTRPIPAGSGTDFPTFSFGFNVISEYPDLVNNGIINYVRFNAGKHHILFTDLSNTVVLDTLVNPDAHSNTCLYLTDVQTTSGAKAVYRMVAVPEDHNGAPAGKIGVRFVHLSPDAGDLEVSLTKPDGTSQAISPTLKFGEASAYQYFDAANATPGSGVLHFALNNTATGASVVTGVPFSGGETYVIVIDGFLADQQRQVATGTNTDGSPKYSTVTIPKNLRAEVRTSY